MCKFPFNGRLVYLEYNSPKWKQLCVLKLIKAEADVHIANAEETTPLISSARKGREKCLTGLLKAEAYVDVNDNSFQRRQSGIQEKTVWLH